MAHVILFLFSLLFEHHNLKDKVSNKMLDAIGGYKGLEERLKTNLQVRLYAIQNGISASPEDKKDRIKKYGQNDPVVKDPKTLWDMIL